jgi:hypothetical protein
MLHNVNAINAESVTRFNRLTVSAVYSQASSDVESAHSMQQF